MTDRARRIGILTIGLAACCALGSALAAGNRYRVQLLDMPAFEVADSAQQNPLTGAGSSGELNNAIPVPAPRTVAPVQPVSELGLAADPGPVVEPGPTVGQTTVPRVAGSDPLGPGEPPASFNEYMRNLYGMEAAEDIADVWRIARDELPDLEDKVKWSNAVIRWALQNPGRIPGADATAMAQMTDSARVEATHGVQVRQSPWGPMAGNIPSGATVRVLSQDGIWLEVEGAGQRGFVCGLWMRP